MFHGIWNLLGLAIEPMFPALQGRLLTAPQGSLEAVFFFLMKVSRLFEFYKIMGRVYVCSLSHNALSLMWQS